MEKELARECGSCQFYRSRSDAPGVCRRYPPRVLSLGGDCLTCWPHVREQDACGEFQPRLHQCGTKAVIAGQKAGFTARKLVAAVGS